MVQFRFSRLRMVAAAAGFAALGACATPPPPPPPPPPPVAVPYRPVPPGGASPTMVIPAVGADGVRQTVNAYISPAQRTWNLRSAFVVASLNCLSAQHAGILDGYKRFLVTHKAELARTNLAVEGEWKKKHGTGYQRVRDTYTTQVYNYFALPPTLPKFCNAALAMSNDSLSVAPGNLDAFSLQALPKLELVFDEFYRSFEQYRVDLASWDAKYGSLYGAPATRRLSADYGASTAPASVQPASGGTVPGQP